MKASEQLDDYIRQHIEEEHPYLHKLYRDSHLYLVHGHMVSGHLQGAFLHLLVELLKPQRILEIGSFTGYSCLAMASALENGGKIVTYEINDEMEDFTRPRLENSPWAEKIDFRIGDVLTCLAQDENMNEKNLFDFIFIDGNKRQYTEYYELSLKWLRQGGLIVTDNTLWDGHVVDETYEGDAQTKGIRAFNDIVAADNRVEKVILPLRDGLTLIRKK